MLKEVYYEHYAENCRGRYWEEERSLPYMVLIRDRELRDTFGKFLKAKGFRIVTWNESYPGVLVNMELKRAGMIYRPCYHECVGGRNYTLAEFLDEVFFPWEKERQKKLGLSGKDLPEWQVKMQ